MQGLEELTENLENKKKLINQINIQIRYHKTEGFKEVSLVVDSFEYIKRLLKT